MSPLCTEVLSLPHFIMCQGNIHNIFLRKGQLEASPWSSSSGWYTHSWLPTKGKRCLLVKEAVLWFWMLDTDSLKETLCTLERTARASLILGYLCTILLQE